MINKKDYKLLMDITSNNIKEGVNKFPEYNLSKGYNDRLDKHFNPIIKNFNDKSRKSYLQKKEYTYYKDIYGEISNILDDGIKIYDLILNDDRVIEPFIKSVGRAFSGAAKSVAKGVTDAANKVAEAAKKAAAAAKKAAEFLKRKIEEVVNKIKAEANKIKDEVASKFKFLSETLDKIKELGKTIIKIKDQIINTAKDAINSVKNIENKIPGLIANIIRNSTKQAKRNYKLAGEIKKAATLEAIRELQNGIKLSRRIALSQPKKPKIKEYKPDMSDFKTNATQSNSDLNLMKKTLTIDLPEVEYDMSPFYLILFVCLSLFLIKKFYL